MTTNNLFSESRSFAQDLIAGIIAINVLVLAIGGYSLFNSWQMYIANAEQRTRNLAEAVDQMVSVEIDKIDVALQNVVYELEHNFREGGVSDTAKNQFVIDQATRVPELEGIRVTDATGLVLFGTGIVQPATASYGDRDFFLIQRDNPNAGLIVTKPILGRVSKQWVISLNRRYTDQYGAFSGVVSAAISIDALRSMVSRFELGSKGLLTLRATEDLGLVVRHPQVLNGQMLEVGDKNVSNELIELARSGTDRATYHTVTPYDQTERIFSYHHLKRAPFVALAGLAADDYLAAWRTERGVKAGLLVVFLLITSLGGKMLWRSHKKGHQEAQRSRTLLKNASDGVHIVNTDGVLVEASDSFFKMLGYERGELLGRHVTDWDDHFSPDEARTVLTDQFRANQPQVFETRHRRKDGSIIDVEVSGLPLDLDGTPLLFNSSRDITERNHMVKELKVSRLAAEQANIAKSQFLATMSHEIRTPLNGILGMAQLMLMPNLEESERLEFSRTIYTSGQSLLTILNDILDISKAEAGKFEITETPFSAEDLAEEVGRLFAVTANSKGLDLQVDWQGPSRARYLGDQGRLRQMLSNLVGNALKFTEQGNILIEVSESQRDQSRATLVFAVTDTGIGIPQDKQSILFQPFMQIDGSSTRKFGGTGLGLSIVRVFAELMNGSVGLTSSPGNGSRFFFQVIVGIIPDGADTRDQTRA
jgi:PAS domain S-box-containing protein